MYLISYENGTCESVLQRSAFHSCFSFKFLVAFLTLFLTAVCPLPPVAPSPVCSSMN